MNFIFAPLLFLSLVFSIAVKAQSNVEDRASVPEVMMNHYLVASLKEFPAIQTYGVATCVAVILYDPTYRVGAIMHISASTNIVESLKIVLNDLEQKANAMIKPQVYPAIINLELDLSTGQISYFEQTVPYVGGDIGLPMPDAIYN